MIIKSFWRYYMLKNQTVWLVKKSLMPNQSDKLLDITDSVLWFCGCLFISKHHNYWHFVYSILWITFGNGTHVEHNHISSMNRINKCIYVQSHAKNQIHTSTQAWDTSTQPESLFWVTVGIRDHINWKWLN